MTALVHLASRLYGTPLLIARAKLDTILAVLGPRIGLVPTELALPVFVPAAAEPEPGPTASGIAIIPIHGTLVRRAIGLDAASGLTSYARIAADLDAALASPDIAGILLDIDSPGGEAGGVFELSARIRAANAAKPVWAHAGDSAFSAGYALACAAQRVTLPTTGGVGSIGVIALHIDQSVRNAQNGLSVTALYAGAHKNDATPHAPLTPQATDALQTEIDRLHDLFVAHVAAMRGLDANAVRATEAALYFGQDALAAGLADGVASLDATLADFATALGRSPGSNGHLLGAPVPLALPARLARPPSTESSMSQPTETAPVPSTPLAAPAAPIPVAVTTVAPAAPPTPTASVAPPAPDPQAEAVAIAELCLLAGCPERTTEFLAARMSAAQVRQVLLQARADQVEIASHHLADATPAATTAANPVLDAVRKRIGSTTPPGA